MADLIDPTTLANLLAAGGFTLTSAQSTVLPLVTSAASRAIRRWCSRQFTYAEYDELYTVGLDGQILLREFPVDAVTRVASSPATVLTIQNTDGITNQRAQVRLATTGDVDLGLTVTGVSLQRVASGTTTTNAVSFTAGQTVAALATAINALGGGWYAAADASYALWPVSDLRAVQGYMPAVGGNVAELKIHTTDLPFELDERAGVLTLQQYNSVQTNPWRSTRWGPPLTSDYGDQTLRGQLQGVRVVYQAGLPTMPEDLQQAAALVTQDLMRQLALDPRLGSESIGDYSYVVNTAFQTFAFSKTVMGILAPYRRLTL
jgi:hypothetical protein